MRIIRSLLVIGIFGLAGCSTLKPTDDIAAQTSTDPFERVNRGVYGFNEAVDNAILKPVAKGYDAVVPAPAKTGVSNFFNNLSEPLNIVNNALQGKLDGTLHSIYRFSVNSTIGLFGLIDVAGKLDVEETPEDLGQTLATWGVGPGPYVMLPFLGPTNFRDGIARVTSGFVLYPASDLSDDNAVDTSLNTLSIIDTRASLLGLDSVLEQQVDRYSFIKSAYDQNRINAIYDGQPPQVEEDFDF